MMWYGPAAIGIGFFLSWSVLSARVVAHMVSNDLSTSTSTFGLKKIV